jgi:hypothetical protein
MPSACKGERSAPAIKSIFIGPLTFTFARCRSPIQGMHCQDPASVLPACDHADEARYRITDDAQRWSVLDALAACELALSLHAAKERCWPARLRSIDKTQGLMQLEFLHPHAPSATSAPRWTCRGTLGDISLRFDLQPLHCEGSVWQAPVPLDLYRFQRREHLRLDTPVGRPYSARLTWMGQATELTVRDLSLGGVGLLAFPSMARMLHAGRVLPRVQMELGADQWFTADLEVRLARTFRSGLLGERLHLGCRFLKLKPQDVAQLAHIVQRLLEEQRSLGVAMPERQD